MDSNTIITKTYCFRGKRTFRSLPLFKNEDFDTDGLPPMSPRSNATPNSPCRKAGDDEKRRSHSNTIHRSDRQDGLFLDGPVYLWYRARPLDSILQKKVRGNPLFLDSPCITSDRSTAFRPSRPITCSHESKPASSSANRRNDRPNHRGQAIRRFKKYIDMDFAGTRDACTSCGLSQPKKKPPSISFTGFDTTGIPYAANGH